MQPKLRIHKTYETWNQYNLFEIEIKKLCKSIYGIVMQNIFRLNWLYYKSHFDNIDRATIEEITISTLYSQKWN